MPIASTNKKAAQVSDVEFVLTEHARVNKLLSDTPPIEWKNLPRDELIGSLPHPSGRGEMPCSGHAARRIWGLAEQALKQSDAVGTLETERVHQALKPILVERFIKEGRTIDTQQVEKALAAAVRQAKRERSDLASSTKKPVHNGVHPKAHEVSACVTKMRNTANKQTRSKDTMTKEIKANTRRAELRFPRSDPSG